MRPGGTESPMLDISARFAPLPPSCHPNAMVELNTQMQISTTTLIGISWIWLPNYITIQAPGAYQALHTHVSFTSSLPKSENSLHNRTTALVYFIADDQTFRHTEFYICLFFIII